MLCWHFLRPPLLVSIKKFFVHFDANQQLIWTADVNLKIPTPSMPNIPILSSLKEALSGGQDAAKDAAAKAQGAAKDAMNLGNKLGDGAHNQLKNFGEQQTKNIGTAQKLGENLWMSIHKNTDRIYEENAENMKR